MGDSAAMTPTHNHHQGPRTGPTTTSPANVGITGRPEKPSANDGRPPTSDQHHPSMGLTNHRLLNVIGELRCRFATQATEMLRAHAGFRYRVAPGCSIPSI